MRRRDFGKALVSCAAGVGLSTLIPGTKLAVGQHVPDYGPLKPVTPKKNLKMHAGSDYHVTQDDVFVASWEIQTEELR